MINNITAAVDVAFNDTYAHAVSTASSKVELEVRYGSFDRGFHSDIGALKWNHLHSYCVNLGVPVTVSKIVDREYGENNTPVRVRERTIYSDSAPAEIIWQHKKTMTTVDVPNYWARVSVNAEMDINTQHPKAELSMTRTQNRHSFHYTVARNGSSMKLCRLDLSRVITTTEGRETTTHEAELEYAAGYPSFQGAHKMYSAMANTVIQVMNDTELIYSLHTLMSISGLVNEALSGEKTFTEYVDRDLMTEAKTIGFKSLQSGKESIVKGSIVYDVSQKVNGLRTLLVICDKGIWSLPPGGACLLHRNMDSERSPLTILDCELATRRLSDCEIVSKYWFVIIDSLYVNGRDVRMLPRNERLRIARAGINMHLGVDPSLVTVTTKQCEEIVSAEELFKAVAAFEAPQLTIGSDGFTFSDSSAKLFTLHPSQKFDTDGLVFTPSNLSYQACCTEKLILKWKRNITIDLLTTRTGDDYKLFSAGNKLFTGSQRAPFDSETMLQIHPDDKGGIDLSAIPSGIIVEYMWDDNVSKLVPLELRLSKPSPNSAYVSADNWEKMVVSSKLINFDVISGHSNILMKKYHNKAKSILLSSNCKPGLILLDIGSGRGADIKKWADVGFEHVFCVEPNPEYIAQLEKRLVTYGMTGSVTIIKAKGQNVNRISKVVLRKCPRGVDVISAMDSLTFFWESEASIEKLSQTILKCLKPGGKFLWKVLNGPAVIDYLKESVNGIANFEDSMISYAGEEPPLVGSLIHVVIPPWVDQDEWLVDVNQLGAHLNCKAVTEALVDETLMSEAHRNLSSLYLCGVFTLPSYRPKKVPVPNRFLEWVESDAKEFSFPAENHHFGDPVVAFLWATCEGRYDTPIITAKLAEADPAIPTEKSEDQFIYWETAANGIFIEEYTRYLISLSSQDSLLDKSSLQQVANYINGDSEEYHLLALSWLTGVAVYIFDSHVDGLLFRSTGPKRPVESPFVILVSTEGVYEVLVNSETEISVFDPHDDYSDILPRVPPYSAFDPRKLYIKLGRKILAAYGVSKWKDLPEDLISVIDPTFLKRMISLSSYI